MDKTALVEVNIENGKKLVEALDKAHFKVYAALWFYLPDTDDWRFMIATPLFDEKGPKEAYTLIQSILKKMPQPFGIALKDVSVVSPKHGLIQLMRSAISTGPGISGIRFTRNTVNNVFIEDAYIYRILGKRPEVKSGSHL